PQGEIQKVGQRTSALARRAHAPAVGAAHAPPPKYLRNHQPVPHGVLRERPRLHKLEQVIRSTGLASGARELVSSKRLASYLGARDAAVDIKIAHRRAGAHVAYCRGVTREQPASQGVGQLLDDLEPVV